MKRFLVMLSIVFTFAGLQSAQAFPELIPSASGNYCEDEVVESITKRFGNNVEFKRIFKVGVDNKFSYWAQTNLCEGYFVFEMTQMYSYFCRTAQYGSRTRYATLVWAMGDCRQLMPSPVAP